MAASTTSRCPPSPVLLSLTVLEPRLSWARITSYSMLQLGEQVSLTPSERMYDVTPPYGAHASPMPSERRYEVLLSAAAHPGPKHEVRDPLKDWNTRS